MTTILDLLTAGTCSPSCLTATTPPVRCRCPCGGKTLHGLLLTADVSALIAGRARGLHQLDDLEVLMTA